MSKNYWEMVVSNERIVYRSAVGSCVPSSVSKTLAFSSGSIVSMLAVDMYFVFGYWVLGPVGGVFKSAA